MSLREGAVFKTPFPEPDTTNTNALNDPLLRFNALLLFTFLWSSPTITETLLKRKH